MNYHDKHIGSRLLACAGALMMISGILMAICSTIVVGVVLGASGFCMLIAAHHFRIEEGKARQDLMMKIRMKAQRKSNISPLLDWGGLQLK